MSLNEKINEELLYVTNLKIKQLESFVSRGL